MAPRRLMLPVALAALPVLLAGCFDEPPIPPTGQPVFYDTFTEGFTPVSYDPATGAVPTALSVDRSRSQSGTASIRLDVPAVPKYAGAAVAARDPQDLTSTNALVFWAIASRDEVFDEIGFGNNFDPIPTIYKTIVLGLPLTTEWKRHLIPIPDPVRLTAENGMLCYTEVSSLSYTAWLDDVKFDFIDPAIMALRPGMATATADILVGSTTRVGGLSLLYSDFDGTVHAVESGGAGTGPAAAYFTFLSSDTSVAVVDATGKITGLNAGQAIITATLGTLPVSGAVTVNVAMGPPMSPSIAPPAPTLAPASVIALLSKPYTPVPVDTWGTSWSNVDTGPNLTEVVIAGDPMKRYDSLQYVGIEFVGSPAGAREIDATSMTHFHVDVWSPDATVFKVKLVDFGPDKVFGGGDDRSHELTFSGTTSPALVTRQWVSFDIPLASFTGLTSRAHLAQLIFSSSTARVFIDNVYFRK